ncbi:MAG: family 10 glycosylhydrolase, partial [Phormidesmis sp.]
MSADRAAWGAIASPASSPASSLAATSATVIDADIDIFQSLSASPQQLAQATSLWESKEIRGIYMSRYQVTGDTNEETIRSRVRYYKQQGINTIIHGVWGNGCPMYDSEVMNQKFGVTSCPNAFQAQWLDWLIDEAHAQDMQVHAYFEKGIKLD